MDADAKTLVVGLDAACWDYLDPLLRNGRLPTLQRLIDRGASGTLRSTLPALTPTAWASIITGKNPGKHGVFGMMWRRPGTYEFFPTSARVRQGTPFWKHLNDRGVRVGLLNVPFTHPPDALDGFVVCGFGTPPSAADMTYPAEILTRIEDQFGPYQPQVDIELHRAGAPPERIFQAERAHQAQQVQMAVELAEEHRVQVLVINLMLLDHANHSMPHMDQIQQAICESDADLCRLLQGFQPDRVVLFSDHGSRRVRGCFLLYNWLLDHGFCAQVLRTPVERSQALNWALVMWLREAHGLSGSLEKALRWLLRRTLSRLPAHNGRTLWERIERHVPRAREYVSLSSETDYGLTRVFSAPGSSGLCLNVVGRESRGVVPAQERRPLCLDLAGALAQIRDPETGQPLFSGAHLAEELYAGPAAIYSPDLVLDNLQAQWKVLEGYYDPILERLHDGYYAPNDRTFGSHSRDGIFVFSGPHFRTGTASVDGHVMDIPALLLYLYGVPIPEDYDGRVLIEAVDPAYVECHPVCSQPADAATFDAFDEQYSEDEAEDLIARLRGLGYVA